MKNFCIFDIVLNLCYNKSAFYFSETVRKVAKIDKECAKLVSELFDLYKNPKQNEDPPNFKLFREYLSDHPNGKILIMLFDDGFPLHLKDRDPKKLCKKVANICRNKKELKAILSRMVKEAKKGYISPGEGLYQLNLLCVPKRNNETGLMTEIRVARHGSFCTRKTIDINSKIIKEMCKIETLPNIKKYIRYLIKYTHVTIRDLKDAFRQLFMKKQDIGWIQYCLFGMKWIDNRQVYGVASAAANCQEFGLILQWICENKYFDHDKKLKNRILIHIDDFLLCGKSEKEALYMGERFDKMCDDLNVKVSHDKDENSVFEGTVHGFGFNLKEKWVEIPDDKFNELIMVLKWVIKYKRVSGAALERICGKLMHWSQFRKIAKVLCYRVMKFIHEFIRKNRRTMRKRIFEIPELILLDFKFWLHYAKYMRRVSMNSVLNEPSITITAATDACDTGGGIVLGADWCMYNFNKKPNMDGETHRFMSINYQEAHAVIMMLFNFRKELTGKKVLLYLDNKSVLFNIYKCWSGSLRLMRYIQEIAMLMCKYCIELRVEFTPSWQNGLADSLSRNDEKRFWDICDTYGLDFNPHPKSLEYYTDLTLIKSFIF